MDCDVSDPGMLRGLYNWVMRLAETRHALWALALVSFIESSVFPIPPDVLLVPMILARPNRAWLIAGVCMVASVLGGVAGYLIGAVLFDEVAQPILALYGYTEKWAMMSERYNEYGAWAVLFAGITPFPYKVITIFSGATGLDFWIFTISSIIARSVRFFIIAALIWKFGPPIREFIEKRLGLVATVSLVVLFGGFVAAKFLL